MADGTPVLLDRGIHRARTGRLPMQSLLWAFAAATVYLPSGDDPGSDWRNLRPVYYAKDGTQMLAVFTSMEAAKSLGDIAPYLLATTGESVLLRMPRTDGLVVNPGLPLGFEVEPAGLSAFRQEITE